jgi:integrase
VDRATIDKVIAEAPDAQWRLIIALARYGGLRTPSETLELCWSHIDWVTERITVPSRKTTRHDRAYRAMPLFPELRPYLEAVRDEVNPGIEVPFSEPVITRYRDLNSNLRTQLLRIMRRAGVEPWERLFHNLRASRQTELADEYPAHVVADWMGNSPEIAERHYLKTTEAHFQRALQPSVLHPVLQSASATARKELPVEMPIALIADDCGPMQACAATAIPPRGFEPLSPP